MVKQQRIRFVTGAIATWVLLSGVVEAQTRQPDRAFQRRQSQIEQIEKRAASQIEAILTPEQQAQYKSARRRGAGVIDGLDAVANLTEEQQERIHRITRRTSQRIVELVSPQSR